MKHLTTNTSNKNLLKRSVFQWFLVGIFFAIGRNKEVLNYFLSTETIIQILFFTIVGGALFFWGTSKILTKKRERISNQKNEYK